MKSVEFTLSIMVIFLHAYGMLAKITVHPRDTEAVVGQPTYLNCSISDPTKGIAWYHYNVSSSNKNDIYELGSLLGNYESRARIEKDSDTGAFNLVLDQVQRSDAGRYICQEEKGQEFISAELVVLDSFPICGSNTKGNKIIEHNSCSLQNEKIFLSCFTSYSGNIAPNIVWRSTDKGNIADRVESKSSSKNITLILPILDHMFRSDNFICETKRAALKQYSCSSGQITKINVSHNYVITQKNVGEEATCLAKTSLHCIYKWIWFDDTQEEDVSNTPGVTLPKEGMYRCEAECITKETQCLIIAGIVHVTTDDGSMKWRIFCGLFIAVVFVLLIVCGVMIWRKFKQRRSKEKQKQEADLEKDRDRVPLPSKNSEPTEQTAREGAGIPYHAQSEDRNKTNEDEKHPIMETATPTKVRTGARPDGSETDVHGAPPVISDEVQTAHAMNPGTSSTPTEVQIGTDSSRTDVPRAPPVISDEVQTAEEMNLGTSSMPTEVQHPSGVHSNSSETGASPQTVVDNPTGIPSENAQVHIDRV